MAEWDYLIVGQGLAGSHLALALIERGQRVCVVDDGHRTSASKVSAGLINPVTGLGLVCAPGLPEQLTIAKARYASLSERLGEGFWQDRPLLRLLQSSDERKRLDKRLADPAYQPFLGPWREPGSEPGLGDELGSCAVRGAASVRVATFLAAVRRELVGLGALCEENFDLSELREGVDSVRWRSHRARRLIFARGYKDADLACFEGLDFRPARGELLEVEAPGLGLERLLSKGRWVVPLGGDRYRLGATYQWGEYSLEYSEEARQELLEAWSRLLPGASDPRVLGQACGIRPATHDRQPYVGLHPERPLGLFNGFGSKGSLLAPWAAGLMADHLLDGRALPASISLDRLRKQG